MALNEKRLKEAVQKELPVFGFFTVFALPSAFSLASDFLYTVSPPA